MDSVHPTTALSPRRVRSVVLALACTAVLAACNPPDSPRDRVGGDCRVGVVGDSLTVGADTFGGLRTKLAERGCPVTRFDARTSRPTSEAADVVESWARSGQLPRILVVGSGTNDCSGPVFRRHAERILGAVGPHRPVVWVDTWRPGCDRAVNDVLVSLRGDLFSTRADHGNLWIVDHHEWIGRDRGPLAKDGVHLNASGYGQYADRIVATITG